MKKLLSIATGLLFGLTLQAATFTTNLSTSNGGAILFTNGATINRVTVVNATTTNDFVALYDANWPTLLWTNSTLITNTLTYVTNVTQIFTNFTGVLTTNVYSNQVVTIGLTNGPTTNSFSLIAVTGAGATNTTIFAPLNPYAITYGVVATNKTPVTITIDYNSTR